MRPLLISSSLPLGLHTELSLDGLDEILVVDPLVSLFQKEDLFVGSTEQDLIQDILVGTSTLASPVEKVDIPSKWSESLQDQGVFKPARQS